MSKENNSRAFRDALGQFATGVTIVTALDQQGEPVGMTASSFNSVSLDPALVLWSIEKRAQSFAAFTSAERYIIHVLSEEQAELCWAFAKPGSEKFEQNALSLSKHSIPTLDNCVAKFECIAEHHYEGGDHIIMVGKVEDFECNPGKPLLYHQGELKNL